MEQPIAETREIPPPIDKDTLHAFARGEIYTTPQKLNVFFLGYDKDKKTGESIGIFAGLKKRPLASLRTWDKEEINIIRADKEQMGQIKRVEPPKDTLSVWVERFRKRDPYTRIPDSILKSPDSPKDPIDIREARKIVDRETAKLGNPMKPMFLAGDEVQYNAGTYYIVGFTDEGTVALAQWSNFNKDVVTDFASDPHYLRFAEHWKQPAILPVKAGPKYELPPVTTEPYDPSKHTRYTVHFKDQAARSPEITKDYLFYKAGKQIDHSAIQSYVNEEIKIVDFSKDQTLTDFYNQAVAEFKNLPQGEDPARQFFFVLRDMINLKLPYDEIQTEGLLNGQTQLSALRRLQEMQTQNINISSYERERLNKIISTPKLDKTPILLGSYIQYGFGVCRQQNAIAAACIERAVKEGLVQNLSGVELRASLKQWGHMWAQVRYKDGTENVCDATNDYMGPPKIKDEWNYIEGYENHKFGVPD